MMLVDGEFFEDKKKMKKFEKRYKLPLFLLLLLALFLFVLPLVASAQIDFTKGTSNFSSGETLIAKVSGNFLEPVTRGNVLFYRDHVQIPIVYELSKVNDDYYIYAMLTGKSQDNYSISLENIRYMSGIQESQENVVKNFTITNGTADFSVAPGFVVKSNSSNTFTLEVQNLKPNSITVSVDSSSDIQSVSSVNLNSGEIKQIIFTINKPESFSDQVGLTSGDTEYQIPIFVTSNVTGTVTEDENQTTMPETNEESFRFEPNSISVSMATDSTAKRIVYILNTGDTDIEDIDLFIPVSLEQYVDLDYSRDIKEDSTEKIEITITSGSEAKTIEGDIIARTDNSSSSMEISLTFIPDYVPAEGEDSDEPVVLTSCEDLEGNVCSEGLKCSGEVVTAKDGICCIKPGICEEAKRGSVGKIIGWALLIFVVLLLLWFLKRYKRVRPRMSLLYPRRY